MLRPLLAHNSAITLTFEEPADNLTLYSDESKVSQVLRNFISNALKFTERGEVRVTAEAVGADKVVFAVADTGIGIAPEDQDAIFLEFTQLESLARSVSAERGWDCRCRAAWRNYSAAACHCTVRWASARRSR